MNEARPLPARALVADIGGTNARFAVADLATLDLSDIRQVRCSEHPNLEAALGDYLSGLSAPPDRAAIAVAGPVTGAEISLTNSDWFLTKQALCHRFRLKHVRVLNDFAALALSLPHLGGAELHQIGGGAPVDREAKAVVGRELGSASPG